MGVADHLYDSRWRKARMMHLRHYPCCAWCLEQGRVTPAEVVHHSTPHNGDPELFWDRTLWVSLCKPCHDGAAQQLQKTGHLRGCDAKGIPADPRHFWFRGTDE